MTQMSRETPSRNPNGCTRAEQMDRLAVAVREIGTMVPLASGHRARPGEKRKRRLRSGDSLARRRPYGIRRLQTRQKCRPEALAFAMPEVARCGTHARIRARLRAAQENARAEARAFEHIKHSELMRLAADAVDRRSSLRLLADGIEVVAQRLCALARAPVGQDAAGTRLGQSIFQRKDRLGTCQQKFRIAADVVADQRAKALIDDGVCMRGRLAQEVPDWCCRLGCQKVTITQLPLLGGPGKHPTQCKSSTCA